MTRNILIFDRRGGEAVSEPPLKPVRRWAAATETLVGALEQILASTIAMIVAWR